MIVAVAAKPKCILHIGPHKTGSTSLQSMICAYEKELNQDGFVLPQGMRSEHVKKHGRKHYGCAKNMANVALDLRANYTGPWHDITTTWKGRQPTIRHQSFGNAGVHTGFEQFLNHAEQKNHSIVVSSEEFDYPAVDCKIFKRWLRPFDTTVVVGYRPFFDFLLSIHKEVKAGQLDPHHITFVQWLPTAIDEYWEMFTVPVIARFEKCFDTIRILPLETGFLNTFACDIMQAGTLCTALRHLTKEIHSNVRTERFDNTTCADKNSLDRIWQHSKTAATEVDFRLSQQRTSPTGLTPLNLASLRAQFDSRMFCNQPGRPKKNQKRKKKKKGGRRKKNQKNRVKPSHKESVRRL